MMHGSSACRPSGCPRIRSGEADATPVALDRPPQNAGSRTRLGAAFRRRADVAPRLRAATRRCVARARPALVDPVIDSRPSSSEAPASATTVVCQAARHGRQLLGSDDQTGARQAHRWTVPTDGPVPPPLWFGVVVVLRQVPLRVQPRAPRCRGRSPGRSAPAFDRGARRPRTRRCAVATALSLRTGLPVAFVRKTAKPYGTAKLAEGVEILGRRVVIIEDVVTTGGQPLPPPASFETGVLWSTRWCASSTGATDNTRSSTTQDSTRWRCSRPTSWLDARPPSRTGGVDAPDEAEKRLRAGARHPTTEAGA